MEHIDELNRLHERLAEIAARREEMADTYEGCDWCCGGGDEEMTDLHEEETRITQRIAALRRLALIPA